MLNSEEALEADLITISDGELDLTATDDGINASGSTTVEEGLAAKESADSSDEGTLEPADMEPGEMPERPSAMGERKEPPSGGGAMGENSGEQLTIAGGAVTVDAGGDGLDSNGDATISGGTVTIFGPSSNANGALDTNGSVSYTHLTLPTNREV